MTKRSKVRLWKRRDNCVALPAGALRYHPASFIEEREDGSIVLCAKTGEIAYARDEYRTWFLDDVQIEDPEDETVWELNIERSRLAPHLNFVGRVMTIEEIEPNTFQDTFYDVEASGLVRRHQEALRRFDGHEHSLPELGPGFKEICEKIDTATDRIPRKQDGKIIRRITNSVFADSELFTAVEEGITPDGKNYEAVYVYRKLPAWFLPICNWIAGSGPQTTVSDATLN